MRQRLLFPILLFLMAFSSSAGADAAAARFLGAQNCLERADLGCAQVALAGIAPASPYAKILQAQIAATQDDHDSVFRLLLPLAAQQGLAPAAQVALHRTLAAAYLSQRNPLPALHQLTLAEPWLTGPQTAANQQAIWQLLTGASEADLLEMRGESPTTQVQGWLDLALALRGESAGAEAAAQWRRAYPDHPAQEQRFAGTPRATAVAAAPAPAIGKVALLLPTDSPLYGRYAEAILAGFQAAQPDADVQILPTRGRPQEIAAAYRAAVTQGARHVVGPLVREEVATLHAAGVVTVPTLALNVVEPEGAAGQPLVMFGLPMEAEAEQLARIARAQGMQSALIIAADNPMGRRMAEVFRAGWQQEGGRLVELLTLASDADPAALKTRLATLPADMIFLAADPPQAPRLRALLDPATPTYGLSHLYDGDPASPVSRALNAVYFVDMPWLVMPAQADFARYRQAAAAFTPGAEQRWFAVGVDAWHLLRALAAHPSDAPLQHAGLTGKLRLNGQVVERQQTLAQFQPDGIRVVPAP